MPNTEHGKSISTLNAVRHGLTAAAIVLPGVEDEADWQSFHDAILTSLAPEGEYETAVASRVAEALWRLRRVAPAERQFIEEAAARDQENARRLRRIAAAEETQSGGFCGVLDDSGDDEPDANPPRRWLPDDADLDKIIRHEAHLSRQLLHAIHELEAAQDRRKGGHPYLARVGVHGLPGT